MSSSSELDRIRTVLRYEPSTGHLIWLQSRGRRLAGSVAGSLTARGYVQLKVFGRFYFAHRLAWALHFGKFPDGVIDHRNGKLTDNRISNLRDATVAENTRNRRAGKGPLPKGVEANNHGFIARIKHEGKRHYLGFFKNADEAHNAYKVAATALHGEFARFE